MRRDRTGRGLIAPRLDTGIRNLFLAPLSRTLEPDMQAVLVWDGAGDHRSHDLICPPHITLLSLSPYSPELNPVVSDRSLGRSLDPLVRTRPRAGEPLNPLRLQAVVGTKGSGLRPISTSAGNVNPVENLWHDLRSHHWSNRKYETVDALFDAAETAWRATCFDPTLIRTACRTPDTETRS